LIVRGLFRSVSSILLVLAFGVAAPDVWTPSPLVGAAPGSGRIESTAPAHPAITGESIRAAKTAAGERDRRAGAPFVLESGASTVAVLRFAGDSAIEPTAIRHSVARRVSLGRAPPRLAPTL